MDRVCILAVNADVVQIREIVKNELELQETHNILSNPMSETGAAPITHWFCMMVLDNEQFTKLKNLQTKYPQFNVIIEKDDMRNFFKSKNLKSVK